jgi:ankyrin repeat protein
LLEALIYNNKNEEAVKLIVNHGFDINSPIVIEQKYDKAAIKYLLTEAIIYGSPDLLRFLINKGADLHQFDDRGRKIQIWSSLYFSVGELSIIDSGSSEYLEKLQILLKAGADPNVSQVGADRLLIHVISIPTGKQESKTRENICNCVKLLVEAGIDLDRQDDRGWTALHSAVWFNNLEAVKILTKAGADPSIKKKDGETPLDFAIKLKREGMAEILEEAEKGH